MSQERRDVNRLVERGVHCMAARIVYSSQVHICIMGNTFAAESSITICLVSIFVEVGFVSRVLGRFPTERQSQPSML